MTQLSSKAVMLRSIDYGDYDLIVTFFTLTMGKISVIVKYAKKSRKRFAGLLEPFYFLNIVVSGSDKKKSMPVLKEAELAAPFSDITGDIKKTSYAAYWTEIINVWLEEKSRQTELFHLYFDTLNMLNYSALDAESLNLLFQIRFADIAGLKPNLEVCSDCGKKLDDIKDVRFFFDIKKGGIVCNNCSSGLESSVSISKGTIKQLLWAEKKDIKKAFRIKFTDYALKEGCGLLERFICYYLGKDLKSLNFLKTIFGAENRALSNS